MPRRARIAVPVIPWHIIQRGNNQGACFNAEEDYHRYLDTLSDMSIRFDCQVHAYVLMTNHAHLLLTPARKESASLQSREDRCNPRRDQRKNVSGNTRFKEEIAHMLKRRVTKGKSGRPVRGSGGEG